MCELKKAKLEKMIKDVISGKLDLPEAAFKTLLKVYENVSMIQETFIEPIEIKRLRPPSGPKPIIKKDPNMAMVISELQTNDLFLRRKQLCMVI